MKVTKNGNVTIRNNFHLEVGILILTSHHRMIDGNLVIEDNVWFGQNVTILQGVKIGVGAIVQASRIVVSDIESFSIAGGYPAKLFKKEMRSIIFN